MSESKLTWSQWLENNHISENLVNISDEQKVQLWNPTTLDREAAWIIFTEIRSRISTQPLHYRSGDEETALDSLYKLFDITRKTIEDKGPDCRHFASLAIQLLNTHLRPLTAKWHKRKIAGRVKHDDDRRTFRKELSEVQPKLEEFCHLFGKIAHGDNYCDNKPNESEDNVNHYALPENLEQNILFDKILFDKDIAGSDDLYKAELNAIRQRRYQKDQQQGINNLAGLACSGGGIRSATFCLGVAQSLSRRGILKDIDYLSTVSGGGYFGAFLSSYLNDSDNEVGLETDKLPFSETGKAEPKPIRQLRNNSKYLLKGGLLGKSRIAGLILFGMLVNLCTLLPVLLGAVALTRVGKQLGFTEQLLYDSVGIVLSGLLLILSVLIFGLPFIYKYWASKRDHIICYEKTSTFTALLVVVIWVLGKLLPQFYESLLTIFSSNIEVIVFFASLPFVLTITAFTLGLSTVVGRVLIILTGIAGPLLLLISYLVMNNEFNIGWPTIIGLFAIAAVISAWLWFINVNQISPHKYYRNRLAETYLLRKGNEMAVDPQLLSKLQSKNSSTPYHLINATLNLPSSKNPELRGRDSDFFMFSRHFCGSPLLGYCKTDELENIDPHLDLGTAMAVSGAAASAYMGTTTIKGLSFWLSLLNIRLGYWLPNPKHLSEIRSGFGAQPFSLWKELFGNINENGKYVNLSDGGHIENLGVYELLRRKCKFIVAIDGEADPDMTFPSLMKVIRYAQIDFGISIQIDLDDLVRNKAGYTKAHFALGKIDYGNDQIGYLLYLKSSLTGNERDYILDYQQNNPTFPHETTADQFFSEAQFEAYRALGEHIGEDLFHSELIKGAGDINMESWFNALVRNLYA